jgi:hypothetical protein
MKKDEFWSENMLLASPSDGIDSRKMISSGAFDEGETTLRPNQSVR